MRARVVKIGNSQGIRIPKPLLEQTGIMGEVELEVDQNQIIIRPILNPRAGWENAFVSMAEENDDVLKDGEEGITHSWDEEEWQW
jgi:antitoxin MazE